VDTHADDAGMLSVEQRDGTTDAILATATLDTGAVGGFANWAAVPAGKDLYVLRSSTADQSATPASATTINRARFRPQR
jgi:hypothetical protein